MDCELCESWSFEVMRLERALALCESERDGYKAALEEIAAQPSVHPLASWSHNRARDALDFMSASVALKEEMIKKRAERMGK